MARIVVVGAGVAGLGAALALGRAGHEVTVVERDATPFRRTPTRRSGGTGEAPPRCATATRSSPGCATCCATATPTCWRRCSTPGATELRFAEGMPDTIEDRSPRPGDEDLVALACRRTTFEWVLRKAALAVAGGLAARRRRGRRPHRHGRSDRASPRHRRAPGRRPDRRRRPRGAGRRSPRRRPRLVRRHRRGHGRGGRRGHRHRLLVAVLPPHRRGAGQRGADRRRPRLPEVRGVPGRQRHLLGHPRHVERRRHAAGALRPGAVRRRGRRAPADRAVARRRA